VVTNEPGHAVHVDPGVAAMVFAKQATQAVLPRLLVWPAGQGVI
jgi:hypothetical protein